MSKLRDTIVTRRGVKMARQPMGFFGAGGHKGYLGIAVMSLQAYAAIKKVKIQPEDIAIYIKEDGEELTAEGIEKFYRFYGFELPEQ